MGDKTTASFRNGIPVAQRWLMSSDVIREELASLRGEMMKAAAPWAHCPADAEDLVQGALVRALEKGDKLRHENVGAWVRTILRHMAVDGWRRQRRQVPLSDRMSDQMEAPVPETRPWWESVATENVLAALPACSAPCRRVYELHVQGLPPVVIAGRLGIAPTTVATRLFRARAQLRRILEGQAERGELAC
jgi:RNA polymerase sigma factor (sigma-70 family)